MDRNVNLRVLDGSKSVALRKESVDRNIVSLGKFVWFAGSLSARRAWIEIAVIRRAVWAYYQVALRKESVDRNTNLVLNA